MTALRTLVFPGPSAKLPPVEALPLGCRLTVARVEEPFAVTASGGYVPACHLAALDSAERDFVEVAERFVGAPYLWGGKTSLGLDCSGLVQLALVACGIPCPRDADMQEHALGRALAPVPEPGQLRRGDRVVVKTHAGEVMAKQLGRMTAQRIELKSFNPVFEDRNFALSEVAFVHRIIWASQ